MAFQVSLMIDADGKAAVTEIKRVEKATKDAGKASEDLSRKSTSASGGVKSLAGSAGVAAPKVDQMAEANQRAAGSMGNLAAQGNDIAVMLMAGQNPMQLAIQQGTQINQVWGQMGVKGTSAFKVIGSALTSMVSPINLITIGSIAAAGAMVQWLSSAGEQTQTFEEHIDGAKEALEQYRDAAEMAKLPTADLEEQFGKGAEAAREYYKEMARINGRQLQSGATGLLLELTQEYEDARDLFHLKSTRSKERQMAAGQANLSVLAAEANSLEEQIEYGEKLLANSKILADRNGSRSVAEDAYISKLLKALSILREHQGTLSSEGLEQERRNAAHQSRLAELQQEANLNQLIVTFGSDSVVVANRRLEIERQNHRAMLDQKVAANELSLAQATAQQTAFETASQLGNPFSEWVTSLQNVGDGLLTYATARIEAYSAAGQMLESLEGEAELQRLIAVYGEDSAQVTAHRADAERLVLERKLETLGVAESVQQQILSAFDATVSNQMATGNWAAAMSGVAAEVRGILSALASIGGGVISNASKKIEIDALKAGKSVADARLASAESQIEMEYRARDAAAGNWLDRATAWADKEVQVTGLKLDRELSTERAAAAKRDALKNRTSRSGGGGGRANAAQKERDAVGGLILRLEDQLAILRETDPVQKEMLSNREALVGATENERAAVRGLIEAHLDEEDAMERKKELTSFLKDEGYDLFKGLAKGGDAAADAWSRVADALAEAVYQALLLGEGPLAETFGTSGGGGWLTSVVDFVVGGLKGDSGIPAKAAGGMVGGPPPMRAAARPSEWRSIEQRASGGMIYGKGGGTSDDNLTWTSNGEYIVNAQSTARNRGLLERINSGEEFPAMASGGHVGGGSGSSMASMAVSFTVDNRSSAPVAGDVQEVAAPDGGKAYKMVLSDMVADAFSTPGGAARRSLKQMGVKQRGPRR